MHVLHQRMLQRKDESKDAKKGEGRKIKVRKKETCKEINGTTSFMYTQKTCTRNFNGMTFKFLLEWCIYTVIFTGTTPEFPQERHVGVYGQK